MEALAQQMARMQANMNTLAERLQVLEGERVHRETLFNQMQQQMAQLSGEIANALRVGKRTWLC